MERTLILLKPDALKRELVGEIISRIERKGLKIIAMKMLKMSKSLAREHYAHIADKPFYKYVEEYMTSTPIIAMVVEGKEAVSVVRRIVGVTNGREAEPGSIRGDFSVSISKNLIHASDSVETAEKEIARFFSEEELFEWKRDDSLYYSEEEI